MRKHCIEYYKSPKVSAKIPGGFACIALFAVLILLVGCHKRNALGLDVDLYLHPEAASTDDLLLQTGIQKLWNENAITKDSLIHVRVIDKIAFLNGTVRTQAEKQKASELAQAVDITVNQVAIRPREVRDSISVEP